VTADARERSAAAELALAGEELDAARSLAGVHPRIAVTRAYFAIFHAIRAQLFAAGFEPRSHGGAIHLFNLHFVKTGTYPPATSRLVARLQKFREEADYAQSFTIDAAGAREELEAAETLVEAIRQALGSG
jgi:uncharacterized protein (UPF0332 family)